MNSNEKNLEREFLKNQLLAKDFVQKEREGKKEQARKISSIFQKANAKDIFNSTSKIKSGKNLNNFSNDYDITFTYYQLNIEYLKTISINLKHLNSKLCVSKNGRYIIFVEYYLNTENDSIIFVKYHFKHIKLHSTNNKINLNTFVFVNSKSEIYYYDISASNDCILLKEFETNMNIKQAKELLAQKKLAVSPSQETRTYKIISTENPDFYEEKKLKDIYLIPKQLLDNFLNNSTNIIQSSELKIETNFLGYTEMPITVQTEVTYAYNDSEIIEVSEKLLEYEIVLYFLSNPDKKVKAKFYLTESEKSGYLALSEKLLENATFENYNDITDFPEILNDLDFYTTRNSNTDLRKTIQQDIKKLIFKNITIEKNLYEHPDLKDTFQNICIEFCKINTPDFTTKYSFNQISDSKLEYKNGVLMQSSVYSIVYQESLYLIEVCTKYDIYQYNDSSFKIFLPVFGISNIELEIFKPVKQTEIDDFLAKDLKKSSLIRLLKFSKSAYSFKNYKPIILDLANIFPNFAITSENIEKSYDITEIYTDTICKKILNCIKDQTTTTSNFSCLPDNYNNYYLGSDDDEFTDKIQFPISSNNITYGYYLASSTKICINSPFKNSSKYNHSTTDNLLVADFKENLSIYKTTLHTLIKDIRHPWTTKNSNILILSKPFINQEFLKFCIAFLLKKQEDGTL